MLTGLAIKHHKDRFIRYIRLFWEKEGEKAKLNINVVLHKVAL